MSSKIKTSISISRDLWVKFKDKIISAYGFRELSNVIEELIKEELAEELVLQWIEESLSNELFSKFLSIEPIKPRVKTKAEEIVRELRNSRL